MDRKTRLSNFIKKEDENLKGVLNYEPKKIHMDIPEQAQSFTAEQPMDVEKSFKLDDLISKQTGISASQKIKLEEEINKRALEKMQEVQEKAYKEAYDLGLKEGTKRAFDTNQEKINILLEELNVVLNQIRNAKKDLLNENETQIIDLIYYCAEKVVMSHIEKNQTIIPEIVKNVIESLDSKENIIIKLNEEDSKSIEHLMTAIGKEYEVFKKLKFVSTTEIAKGGCTFETDHGLVDATLKERFGKLWDVLNEHKPNKAG